MGTGDLWSYCWLANGSRRIVTQGGVPKIRTQYIWLLYPFSIVDRDNSHRSGRNLAAYLLTRKRESDLAA